MSQKCWTAAASTDVGRVRDGNEDAHAIDDQMNLFVVADGMGGHNAGEEASRIAVEEFPRCVRLYRLVDDDVVALVLSDAANSVHKRIRQEGIGDKKGMGTTLVVALLRNTRLFVGCVGDSRAYLLRGKRLVQLTEDQKEPNPPFKLRQALGRALADIVTTYVDLRCGDRLLLCSDGLNGMVPDELIRQTLQDEIDPKAACDRLIARANAAGGNDNITAIVVDFNGEIFPSPTEADISSLRREVYVVTND